MHSRRAVFYALLSFLCSFLTHCLTCLILISCWVVFMSLCFCVLWLFSAAVFRYPLTLNWVDLSLIMLFWLYGFNGANVGPKFVLSSILCILCFRMCTCSQCLTIVELRFPENSSQIWVTLGATGNCIACILSVFLISTKYERSLWGSK